MPENGVRSTYSQCPVQILMYDDIGLISTGSSFFYEYNNEWFLITNWHNLSGRHFLTKEPLSGNRFPTYIKAKFSSYLSHGEVSEDNKFCIKAHKIDIYRDYNPIWYEHPELKSKCDVVAIPLNRPETCPIFMHNAANLISKIRIPVKPGNPAFIIGFPKSLSVGFGLPLWKSGYIASEPHYSVTIDGDVSEIGGLSGGIDLPAFYIDSQTREGMSGSPIFASYTGNWDMTDPYNLLDPEEPNFFNRDDIALGENRMEFIGCYSARIGKNIEGASLGLCWSIEAIDDICKSKQTGKNPQVINIC